MKPLLLGSFLLIFAGVHYSDGAAQQVRTVSAEALRDAAPAEWLSHGRDQAETRYSPLDQIDESNVARLGLAWTWDWAPNEPQGRVESTPLVSDGVLYATGTWNVVFALDARTGALKWKWNPGIVRGGAQAGGPSLCCGPVNRGVALYEGKVYTGLLDGRLVALDAETGEPVWVQQTTPPGTDYSITGAPRIVNGRVIIGNSGAEYGVRGYVTAYDAETGEQLWRTYTVPGDPSLGFESPAMEMAATTWNGEWWKLGGGGTAWDSFAFDPEANLLYVGTGNGSPWNQEYRSPGGGDNLFLASILALKPETGELVWHYQTTPGENWDYTAVQSIILADVEIGGATRKILMQAPKNGFFYVLDRLTGELISAEAIGHVTWATGVDLETGRPIETPEARYDESGSWLSPAARGTHNYDPMSYSPLTGLAYIPGQNTQSFYRRNPNFEASPGRFNTGNGGGDRPEGPPAPTPSGFLLAWDPVTNQERWRFPLETQRNGGTLATAGNLVFSGGFDGRIFAHNATSGEKLWERGLAPGPASPITYELDGRQYLTILTGPAEGSRVWTFVLDGSAAEPARAVQP